MFWSDFPNICMNIAKKEENYNSTIVVIIKNIQKTTESYAKLRNNAERYVVYMPNQKGPTLGRSGFLHWVELHPGRQYRSGGSRLSPDTCSSLPWDDVTSRPYCSVVCLSLDTITTMFWSDFPNICMNIAKKEKITTAPSSSSSKTFKKLRKVTNNYKQLVWVSKLVKRVSQSYNELVKGVSQSYNPPFP